MSESRSTLHGFGKALEKWKSFTPLREERKTPTMETRSKENNNLERFSQPTTLAKNYVLQATKGWYL